MNGITIDFWQGRGDDPASKLAPYIIKCAAWMNRINLSGEARLPHTIRRV